MPTQNICLFHCLHCGHVCDQFPGSMPPFCCGQEMVKAGEQTIALETTNRQDYCLPGRTVRTEQGACCTTRSATLPKSTCSSPVRP